MPGQERMNEEEMYCNEDLERVSATKLAGLSVQ